MSGRGTLTVVGVGPGDPDLLTVKAVKALQAADVVAYPVTVSGHMAADSAAPRMGAARHLPFTLPMTGDGAAEAAYDAAAEAILACLAAGEDVALLCEGDPMLYGSAASIMDRLAGEAVRVVPGITAASAAAAASGVALARGEAPVTVMPATAGEAALRRVLAQPGGVVVYKVGRHADAVRRAAAAAGRTATVVEKATLPGERVTPLAGTHGALPYFSCVVAADAGCAQAPWDGARVAVAVLGPSASEAAARAVAALRGAGLVPAIHGKDGVCGAEVSFAHTPSHLAALYREGVAIVAVMAAGIVVRALGPLLDAKGAEPPVVAMADDGSAVVPLLGAHRGGGPIAEALGEAFGVRPAVTTMGDVRFGVALDAPPAGYAVADPAPFKRLAVRLAAGEGVAADPGLAFLDALPRGNNPVRATVRAAEPGVPTYIEKRVALGMGASRGADAAAAVAAVSEMLADEGIDPRAVAVVASLDVKADEAALQAVADHLGAPLRVFGADALAAEEPRLATPSEVVREAVGVPGVAEAAALAAAGAGGTLMRPKRVAGDVTMALALAERPIGDVGRARGELVVVGLGPGPAAWRTPEASRALATAEAWVGYTLYLDMVEDTRAPHQTRHDFPLGGEADRVRFALERAGEGRRVALISSGDPGIYAMATLAAEMLEGGAVSPAASRVVLSVVPGVSAAQAAAARVGAPLGHDFCFISLSDLLTPWPVIERRLRAAADGDFAVALYNPRSQRRTEQLGRAFAILGEARPATTPVVIASNVGRPGETVVHTTLGAADPAMVDMLSVVLVGAAQTRAFGRGDGSRVVYTPRGYQVEDAP